MNSAPGGYLALLRTPHVTPLFAWAALARLQFGVVRSPCCCCSPCNGTPMPKPVLRPRPTD